MKPIETTATGAGETAAHYVPANLNPWTRPDCYMGSEWSEWYVFLGRNRDSDCLTESNFEKGLEAVQAVMSPESADEEDLATVQVVRESHWAVGWIEWIAIHKSDSEALKVADKLTESLDNYPVLDEEDFSQREQDQAEEVWRDCYSDRDRLDYVRKYYNQFSFHSFADLIGCIRGRFFSGYASELLA